MIIGTMSGLENLVLVAIFFVTSSISVVTGSTSVITVPVMIQLGVAPHTAVATNMFALTFMSLGGTLPFFHTGALNRRRLPILAVLTMLGSAAGALLLTVIPASLVPRFVSIAIVAVAAFSTLYRRSGIEMISGAPSRRLESLGYFLTLLLGIYGGLFSGGYVTILTAVFVAAFRMTFSEAIATTKLVNVFSSGIATIVFMEQGLVDYRLGIVLGATMFAGAWIGGHFARRLGNIWLRRIYLAVLWLLGLKALLIDVFRGSERIPDHAL